MQAIAAPIFRGNSSISQMLHAPNLLPSPFSAFHRHSLQSMGNYSEGGHLDSPPRVVVPPEILEEREETTKIQPVIKKRGRVVKEGVRRMKKFEKKDTIEIGESDEEEEEDAARTKWKDFEVHHLIAIRGEMEDEFIKTANKQGIYIFSLHY
jgi:hypothetical protein